MQYSQIGVVGLSVMGENLARNFLNNNYHISVFNRSLDKVKVFEEKYYDKNKLKACYSLSEFCQSLEKPRKILLMVKSGTAVDELIENLLPLIDENDIIIDGGNSYFEDTNRRCEELKSKNIFYLGCGISGGEYGALHGPSMMIGGDFLAWENIKEMFQTISAKANDNKPCCNYVGVNGAGHFVKMVHNGIEYSDMQLIAESYDILRKVFNLTPKEIARIFAKWNNSELNSYLIEITSTILNTIDEKTNTPLIDNILDVAMQKGTGSWTVNCALNLNAPVPSISGAVFARGISTFKDLRVETAKNFKDLKIENYSLKISVEDVRLALYAAKICTYAQGFSLLEQASKFYNWQLNLGDICLLWRNGCIIRANFLTTLSNAYEKENLSNIINFNYFKDMLKKCDNSWRKVVALATFNRIGIISLGSALSYFDMCCSKELPTNLIQAQRDFFGAHNFERKDTPRGNFFHFKWE